MKERERERTNSERKKMSEKERNATGLEETRDTDERSFERGAKERERETENLKITWGIED